MLESSPTRPARNTPGVRCSIRSSQSYLGNAFHNCYAAVNISFDKAKPRGPAGTSSYVLDIEEDDAAWTGKPPLFASFWISPSTILCEPGLGEVSFGLKTTPMNAALYAKDLGLNLVIHTAPLKSTQVYLTKDPPLLNGSSSVRKPESAQYRDRSTSGTARQVCMQSLTLCRSSPRYQDESRSTLRS